MSSLYPSVPHFAIEESVVKPSLLSKYGVNGFPTLFVLNSTMRARYHGSRTLSSLLAFYMDVTGIEAESFDKTSLDKMDTSVHENGNEQQHRAGNVPVYVGKIAGKFAPARNISGIGHFIRGSPVTLPKLPIYRHFCSICSKNTFRVRSLWEHPFGI
ncbi:hypothetical protein OSB04_003637 [Centaurea solstitialis]|uniref:Thioredoxin domain-containing protein n=1 Tax=Centaurea solstitialis TaxID=347529 RepID=A0AA38U5P6_9ASTR|nr:hypothetical protein OSB04_003637 [Centaurea solstitialis]